MSEAVAYKVLTAGQMAVLEHQGSFAGAPVDLEDGFIHLSTSRQLAETIDKHFAGQDNLHVAAVDLDALGEAVKWEELRGGQLFPHIYGALPLDVVIAYGPLEREGDGSVKLPVAGVKALAFLAIAVLSTAAQDATPRGVVTDPCAGDDGRSPARDFAQRCVYHADNARLIAAHAKVRVVFMGDSITEGWKLADPSFFSADIVDRGISGQTTAQMLVRFRDDVIALKPAAVHIMAGTNDIAGNTGAATLDMIEGNIRSMAELARVHGIEVIIASVPPAKAFSWRAGMAPAPTIIALNKRLRAYALANRFGWVDYHAALAAPDGGMKDGFAADGVHPTKAGYAAMRPLALAALAKS